MWSRSETETGDPVSTPKEGTNLGDLFRLDGKGVVVVGAGNGMGAETAAIAAALGARLLCVDVDSDRAEEVAAEVGGVACVADVTTAAGVADVLAAAQSSLGRIDGLVDIVGFSGFGPIRGSSDEKLREQFGLNFDHAFRLLRESPDLMTANGSYVFVASSLGLTGAPQQALYGAAKAGLISLVRSAALELAPIRCNAVAPGVMGTPRVRSYLEQAGVLGEFSTNSPQGRIGHPREIASVIAFLLGEGASFLSGQTILVDGGVSAKSGYPDMPG